MAKKNKLSLLRRIGPQIARGLIVGVVLALIINVSVSQAKKQGRLEGCSLGIVAALSVLAPEATPDLGKIATACQDIVK
jgi:hypothetical protein